MNVSVVRLVRAGKESKHEAKCLQQHCDEFLLVLSEHKHHELVDIWASVNIVCIGHVRRG